MIRSCGWKGKKIIGLDLAVTLLPFFIMEATNFTLDNDWLVTNHSLLQQAFENSLCAQWSSPKWTPSVLSQINSVWTPLLRVHELGLIWPPYMWKIECSWWGAFLGVPPGCLICKFDINLISSDRNGSTCKATFSPTGCYQTTIIVSTVKDPAG